jgi:hypothetical protein
MEKILTPDKVIDALGGTSVVAGLCDVSDPAVSQWRRNGIPRSQLKFLRLAKPAVFAELQAEIATPP